VYWQKYTASEPIQSTSKEVYADGLARADFKQIAAKSFCAKTKSALPEIPAGPTHYGVTWPQATD
jgi:hypothetical protein